MELRPASSLSPADLAAVWRDAYEGYFVPLAFDETMLARHVRWSGIDLDQSVVGFADGEPFGLSLVARQGKTGWIGGFGIAAAHRRKGLATELMRAHAAGLDALGVGPVRLEVIDINPAVEIYCRAGFKTVRELLVLNGALAETGRPGVFLEAEDLAEAHARLHRAEPSWRRGLPRLRNILDASAARVVGVEREGRAAAFAVILDLPDGFGLFDAAAEDEAAGGALLDVLAFVRPGAQARVVDEPPDTPLAGALQTAGWTRTMRQFEMIRVR